MSTEIKPCPRCGYVENMSVKPMTNAMNEYVDKATGKTDGVYNSETDELTVKGKLLVRKDKWVKVIPATPKAPEPKK